MNEVVIRSSGSKYSICGESNIIIGNGLIGDTYISDFDGNVSCVHPIGIQVGARNDRVVIELVGENGEFTDKQISAILPTLLVIKKYLGNPKIFRYEDLYELEDDRLSTISDKFLKQLQHNANILWKKEE